MPHDWRVHDDPKQLCGDNLALTMRAGVSNQSFVRSIRRSVGWKALKEYVGGALWVLPSIAAAIALVTGYLLAQVEVRPGSALNRLAFQGTAGDVPGCSSSQLTARS